MQIIADLHLHSTFSDGRSHPKDIVKILARRGIKYCSLTDHDSVNGLDLFFEAARQSKLKPISGVEVSCLEDDFQIHVLGYGFDTNKINLVHRFDRLLEQRSARIEAILIKLIDLGFNISRDKFFERYPGPYWGRPHVAEFMVRNKLVSTYNDAFDLYLAEGKEAYIPNQGFTVSEAIDIIHDAGGLAVLAHPGIYLKKFPFRYWEKFDFDGVELIHPWHRSEKMIIEIRRLAIRKNWFVTGGTDFHGRNIEFYKNSGITELDMNKFLKRLDFGN